MSEELKLDKSAWKPVTFGDVVAEVRNSTKDPVADGIERVVGLEHIEPECIHLRDWASIEEDTTFTKVFRKGHVLFGRRRAYLKKAALADFDGICSGDITVMEAKDGLIPELLPFLVNNDKFFDYAVQHSAGGLSPRTKFKDIANYEFLLPPKDEQANLAELLWAADRVEQRHDAAFEQVETLPLSFANYVTGLEQASGAKIDTEPLGEVADVIDCKHRTAKREEEGIPIVSPGNINWGPLDLGSCKHTSEEEYQSLMDHCTVQEWDLVMGRNQTFGVASFVQPGQRFVLGQDTVLIKPRTFSSKYIYLALQSSLLLNQIERLSIGSTFKRINLKDIRSLRIPVADSSRQQEADQRVDEHLALEQHFVQHREANKKLKSVLLNDLLGCSGS